MKLRYVCLERSKSFSKSISMAFPPSTSPLRNCNIWTGSFSFIPPFPSSLFSCSTLHLSSAYLHNFHMPACHNPLFHVPSPSSPLPSCPRVLKAGPVMPCRVTEGWGPQEICFSVGLKVSLKGLRACNVIAQMSVTMRMTPKNMKIFVPLTVVSLSSRLCY